MASLKALRMRINSVKSTRKITQAMKMVAAAKLRRAQTRAEAARPYAERMERMLASLGAAVAGQPDAPRLLVGTGGDAVHLLVVITRRSRPGRRLQHQYRAASRAPASASWKPQGKTVKILPSGARARPSCKREFGSRFVGRDLLRRQEGASASRMRPRSRRRSPRCWTMAASMSAR